MKTIEQQQQQHEKNKHCAILQSLCRHCQSKAMHSRIWAQAMPFVPIKQVDLLTLKVVSESHVTWAASVPILVFFSGPLCSRLSPDVRAILAVG